MTAKEKIPVLAVVGPTASGKTALGVSLAEYFNGEVVSADSMQIYKGMSIATAKPTIEEMKGIPHHLIGFLDMNKSFSVADYVKIAGDSIKDIHKEANSLLWLEVPDFMYHHCLKTFSLQRQHQTLYLEKSLQLSLKNTVQKCCTIN